MKAIIKKKPAPGIDIGDIEKPDVGENDILIKILAGSLCGSDVHIYEWTKGYEWLPMPIVPGHEFAGEVAETGGKVTEVAVGDKITAMPQTACGQCAACRIGRGDACTDRIALGMRQNGAFAEYMLLKRSAVIFKIPPNVPVEAAAMTEPLSVALQGLDLSGIKAGETAAVFGPGPIGLLTIALLKAAGASRIIATGTGKDKRRLEVAAQMGADTIIDVEKEDPVKVVLQSAGYLDYVFEATGIPQTIRQGLRMVKRGGKVMIMGIHAADIAFDPIDLVRKQKSLIGVYNYNQQTWKRCLALMASGKIDIAPIITHRIPFSRGDEGFQLAVRKEAAKVIFVPEE